MIEIKQSGVSIENFRKAVQKLDREYRKNLAAAWRKRLREAATYGRSLISGLFGGRGKRLRAAFKYGVRVSTDDLIGRVGYRPTRAKGSFWWLGRIYEGGAMIRNRSKSGRLFTGQGQRVSGGSRLGRMMRRAGHTGSKALWIPIGANRAGDGSAVVTPSQFFAEFKGRSVVKMTPGGKRIAFAAQGGDLIPMFVLKDQIPVPARPVARPTAMKFFPKIVDDTGHTLFSNFRGV